MWYKYILCNITAITYDAIGNPLEYINGATFTWQNGRQLATANRSGKDLTFKYDDNGIRTEKVCVSYPASGTKTETTKFYLDGSTILAQETTGVLETSIYGMITTTNLATVRLDFFYDETGDVVGFKYGGNKYFYIKNLQGDVTDIVDNTGAIVVSYLYDSWGKIKSTTDTSGLSLGSKNPFRYRSYYYDSDLALYYLQSRYYDPNTGRFINADGYVSTGTGILGYNMFAYCKNNPVNSVDPTGKWSECHYNYAKEYELAAYQEHMWCMKHQALQSSTTVATSTSCSWNIEDYVGAGASVTNNNEISDIKTFAGYTYKSGVRRTYRTGNISKFVSVYSNVNTDNIWNSFIGLRINIGKVSLDYCRGLGYNGVSFTNDYGGISNTLTIYEDLLSIGSESSTTTIKWDDELGTEFESVEYQSFSYDKYILAGIALVPVVGPAVVTSSVPIIASRQFVPAW